MGDDFILNRSRRSISLSNNIPLQATVYDKISELVFGHNNFLWPCQGIQPPDGTFLHLYAVDLARTRGHDEVVKLLSQK